MNKSEGFILIDNKNNIAIFQEAIKTRCSRRKYIPETLEFSAAAKLQELIDEYNAEEKVNMRLVLDNGDAFNGFRKSYGMFSGVRNYIGLIGDKNDFVNVEKLGYYGEMLVLHATSLGLGTCWVGGTFSRKDCPFDLSEDESIIGAITIGRVSQDLNAKEKLIRRLTHRKTKAIEQMYISESSVPDWFSSGMEAVRFAPSAVNRQPVIFTYKDGNVTAAVKNITGEGFALDLGIAKLHFEIGAVGGTWQFGNGAAFVKNDNIK